MARPEGQRVDHNSKEEEVEAHNERVKFSYDLTDRSAVAMSVSHSDYERTGQEKYIPDYVLYSHEINRYSLQYDQKFDFGDMKLTLYGMTRDGRYDSANSATKYTSVSYIANTDETNYGAMLQFGLDVNESNFLTLGGDFKIGDQSQDKDYPDDPDFMDINGGKEKTYALFAQDEITLFEDKLIFNIGGRMDWWERYDGYSHDDGLSPSPGRVEYESTSDSRFNPKFGFRYNINEMIGVRGTVGTAYKTPQMTNMYREFRYWSTIYKPNPDLQPEKSVSYDLGIDVKKDQFSFSLSAFRTDADDFIFYVDQGKDAAGNTIYQYMNIGEVVIKGYEAEASYRFHPDWKVFMNHVVNEARIETFEPNPGLEDKYLKNTPLEKTSVGIVFSNPDILTVSFSIRHVGTIYTKDDNSEEFGNYWTANAKITRKFKLNDYTVEAGLEAQNIFDELEQESATYVGPGSTVMGSIRFEF